MKTRIIGVSLMILAISLMSCEEDKKPTKVWGKMFCSGCQSAFNVNGTLGEGGEDYWGSCSYSDGNLSFVVAQGDPTSSSFSSEFYYSVSGIAGPPNVGVYGSGEEIIDNPNLYTTFSSMRIMNSNEWYFTHDDIPDTDQCYVRLFAEPLITETDEGEVSELTASEYGEPEEFELYVNIICNGIDVECGTGPNLSSASIQLFFDRCN